jgi:protein O-GlcNAc transferase
MNRQQRRATARRKDTTGSTAARVDELFRAAVAWHQAGRLSEAAAAYRAVLGSNPGHADALHLAGVVELQLGRAASAVELIARAIRINDQNSTYFCQHGDAFAQLGRLESAIRSYDQAIRLRPDYAEAHTNRGDALAALGKHEAAVTSYDAATEAEPHYAEAWCNRGNCLRNLGRLDEAVTSYDRALGLRLDIAEAWSNRGITLLDLERHDEAITSFDSAITLRPTMAEAWHGRGRALAKAGRPAAAMESYDRALAVQPDHAETWSSRGVALFERKRPADAVVCYDRAIKLKPDLAEAWYNRGNALQMLGRFADALGSYDQALALRPGYPEVLSERVHLRYLTCDWRNRAADDAVLIDLVRRNLTVAPFVLLATSAAPMDQLRCARQWSRRFLRAPGPLARSLSREPQRRLTVAYLSGDFRQHPLAYLMADVLEQHDRSRFKVVCYSLWSDDGSAIRHRLAGACDRFVELSDDLTDVAAARVIASDATDIVVDLSGHTVGARQGVLAQRPAPIQVSYLGYIGSMGADFIDYIVADPVALPMSLQQYYDERIVHLPVSYQPNGKSREMSAHCFTREECGLPPEGFVFCCFNASYKIGPETFAIWMRLLASVPGSVLWLAGTDPLAEANLRREAADRGIAPERLVLSRRVDYADYLARCAIGDLFLDTLPYCAGATASDVLWAGLPLVTRIGGSFAGRMAASVLTGCGLPELIAEGDSEYEALALRLAAEPSELRRVRAVLRDCRNTSALFDANRSTRYLEEAYTKMWHRWCNEQSPLGFAVPEHIGLLSSDS